jgi:hypothetical protein
MDNIINYNKAAGVISKKYLSKKISRSFYWKLMNKINEWAIYEHNLMNQQKNIK